jgi:hypothetical protein
MKDDTQDGLFDPAELRVTDAELPGILAAVPRKIQKRRQHFIKVPWTWVERLVTARHLGTYRVALHLLYQHWKSSGRPITLANSVLATEGVRRGTKWRALGELEALGLIDIERRPRKSPRITVLL